MIQKPFEPQGDSPGFEYNQTVNNRGDSPSAHCDATNQQSVDHFHYGTWALISRTILRHFGCLPLP